MGWVDFAGLGQRRFGFGPFRAKGRQPEPGSLVHRLPRHHAAQYLVRLYFLPLFGQRYSVFQRIG
jgi:hypothetical protein